MNRWPHVRVSPTIVLVSVVGTLNHHSPSRALVSMLAASATAPSALRAPAPWVSTSVPASGTAEYCSIALTTFGVGLAFLPNTCFWAEIIRATTPVVTAAAMLVPLSLMCSTPFNSWLSTSS